MSAKAMNVQNVSPMICRDSIRVEGQRGALILEVEYEETPQLSGGPDEVEKGVEKVGERTKVPEE